MKKVLLLATLVGSSVLFAACTHEKPAATPGAADTSEEAMVASPESSPVMDADASPAADAMMEEGEVQVVNIEAGSFYYKPDTITVKKGQKVRVVMTSVDMMHDFRIDELNVQLPVVQSGKTGTVEFTADQVGTFEYYCGVGQHRKNGQVGTLVVTE